MFWQRLRWNPSTHVKYCQLECQRKCHLECQMPCQNMSDRTVRIRWIYMSDRMSNETLEYVWEKSAERMLEYVSWRGSLQVKQRHVIFLFPPASVEWKTVQRVPNLWHAAPPAGPQLQRWPWPNGQMAKHGQEWPSMAKPSVVGGVCG